ncbi:MAG: hypothetical protein FWC26_04090 [Fibromonadales bacterium]|nr:hypothetical protein [Fibromonadales bacterium]
MNDMAKAWLALNIIQQATKKEKEIEWTCNVPFRFEGIEFIITVAKYINDNSYYVLYMHYSNPFTGESNEKYLSECDVTIAKFCKTTVLDGKHIALDSLLGIIRNYTGVIEPPQNSSSCLLLIAPIGLAFLFLSAKLISFVT